MTKQLYIETVGCQMNMLDSELVVASLRKAGYELVDSRREGRHDSVQHVQRAPACRGQDLQRPGPAEATPRSSNPHKIIGVLGCMAQKDQRADLRAGAVCRPGRRAGAVAPDSGPDRQDRQAARAADGSQPRPQGRQPRTRSSRASRASIRCATRRCGRRRFRRSCGS